MPTEMFSSESATPPPSVATYEPDASFASGRAGTSSASKAQANIAVFLLGMRR
jgi:hypothetical protein